MSRHFIITLIFIAIFPTIARATEAAPRILSMALPGMINADGSGSYNELLHQALGIKSDTIELLPAKRALKQFSDASVDTCIVPHDSKTAKNLGIDSRGKIFSEPFNTSFAKIISQRDMLPVQSLRELEDRTVGVLLGFPISDEVVATAARVMRPNSMEALLKMLELGRIDFAYVHFPDVLLSFAQLDIARFPESEMRFQIVSETIACTSDMTELIYQFNEAVDLMYENNEIKDILGSAYTGR